MFRRAACLGLAVFLTACQPASPPAVEPPAVPTLPHTAAPPAQPSASASPSPQPPTPTLTPIPTATLTPALVATLPAYLTEAGAITLTAEVIYTPWEMVTALAWPDDGRRLAVAAGQQVHVYQTGAWEELAVLDLHGWANSLSFAPETPSGQDILAAAMREGGLQIWNVATAELLCTLQAHPKGSTGAVWSPDGLLLASSGNDPILRLWDVSLLALEGKCEVSLLGEMIGGAVAVPDVEFDPDGSLLASADGSTVRLRDPGTLRLVRTLRGSATLFDTAFFPGEGLLVSTESGPALQIWDYARGEPVARWTAPPGSPFPAGTFIWRLAVHPSGELVAAGVSTGEVLFWHAPLEAAASSWSLVPAHGRAVAALAFAPDGSLLASGGYDGVLRVWRFKAPVP